MDVRFSGRVRDELPEDLLPLLEDELKQLFQQVDPNRSPIDVYVPRTLAGHTPEHWVKVILAVEVRYPEEYERHIVKMGQRDKVAADFTGWQVCTRGRMVASRIFVPVRMFEVGDHRVAVLYRDGFALFGPDADEDSESQPKMLEKAVAWAVSDDSPDPLSVERALAYVFTDLGLWFYRGATTEPALAHQFYAGHLRQRSQDNREDDVLDLWRSESDRRDLRRHAVWMLAGRDAPDADPIDDPARYLDPVDFVRWMMKDPHRLPSTLVGRSHGDLHARNVLVGVRRGEVQYPVVFDYGDMTASNVLAWDFAKLETELKARLLPVILRNEAVLTHLIERSELRRLPTSRPQGNLRSENARRADRLVAFLAFEELLDDLTETIHDVVDAEQIAPLREPPTGIQQLDRLAGILLRVRREAANWLGYKFQNRKSAWKDELYFALAVYGLLNVRWDYSQLEQEAAIVSAGVAAARMTATPALLREAIAAGPTTTRDYVSYRAPLAILYDRWKSQQFNEGCELGGQMVLTVTNREKPRACTIEVCPQAYHAVPLIGQALLLETEVGNLHAVERVLEGLRALARDFEDSEMLGRIGRLYKDSGDHKWEEEFHSDGFRTTRAPSLQMYDMALEVYAEAFDITQDWYAGINAATLALLTGNAQRATDYARRVAEICQDLLQQMNTVHSLTHDRSRKKDRYWLYATEGEAALILGDSAEDFYREALAELTPGQSGMANSSYKQVCRLWRHLGEPVEPVLQRFENSHLRDFLTPHFLGREFSVQDSQRLPG